MAKKTVKKKDVGASPIEMVTVLVGSSGPVIPRKVLTPVSVDFPSEQLNNLAIKINEIIEELNG